MLTFNVEIWIDRRDMKIELETIDVHSSDQKSNCIELEADYSGILKCVLKHFYLFFSDYTVPE